MQLNALTPAAQQAATLLRTQPHKAQLSHELITQLCATHTLTTIELALQLLPLAASYAHAPVSQFYVGAIAIAASGNFYFGANQEFAAMPHTIHAEQSAVMHAWHTGETHLTDVVVNYTPCGYCRQFMQELNSAAELKIHLPHSQYNPLQRYLPDAFGPRDLGVSALLFDTQIQHFHHDSHDPLVQTAVKAASLAYAPYSGAYSAVAMQVGEQIIMGRYAENAAYNPSFLPLQAAINMQRLCGCADYPVSRIVLAEQSATISNRAITQQLADALYGVTLEYIAL